MKTISCVLLLCLSIVFTGCGAKTQNVTGNVTFDGEPVSDGYISFTSDKGGQGVGATISNGQYNARVPVGKHKVQITASKKMKLPPGEFGMNGEKEEVRQYIPDQFNTQTKLNADIPAANPLNFDLKSK